MSGDPIARLRAADPLRGELPPPLERMPARERVPAAPARRRGATALVVANVALLAAVLLHGLDHGLIQERGVDRLSFEVVLGAMALLATSALSLAVVLRGDRRAPLVAVVAGPWVAAAVVVGHFIPRWSEFSDPYADADLGAVSYAAAWAVVAAGVALAAVALLTRGARGGGGAAAGRTR
jgi:hypothetical protein